MAFTLPSDLSTSWVDNVSTLTAADWNATGALDNALKAAVATWGINLQSSLTAASESTSSTTWTDLTTTTDQVTAAIGSSGRALVILRADITAGAVNYGGYMSYTMSGANTSNAMDPKSIQYYHKGTGITAVFLEDNLAAGFTTFKLKYKCASGTSTFANRRITVIPFPSTDGTHAAGAINLDTSSAVALGMSGAGVNRPVFDAAATQVSNSTTSLTWTHTATAGATVLVAVTRGYAGTGCNVTYDGDAMSYVGSVVQNNSPGDSGTTYLFSASGVAGGAKTVVASWTSAATGAACSVSYTGVAGLGQVTTTAGSSATPTQTVATTNIDGRILFCVQSIRGGGSDTITVTSGGTQRALAQPAAKYYDTVVQDAAGASVNFAVTPSATPARWGGVSVELLPAIPTYSKPTWVGTGGGVSHFTNPGTSWVDTVPADANMALVWVSEMPGDQTGTLSVTIGGSAMTEVTGSPWCYDYTNNYNRIRCFYLANPPTGPNKTVAVTSGVSSNYQHARAVYYGGVTSVAPAVFRRGMGGTQPSMSVPGTSSNHLYAQAFSYRTDDNNSTYSTYTGGTQRALHTNSQGYTQPMIVGDGYGNGGTLTFGATRNSTSQAWGGTVVDLSNSSLPTPSTPTWVGTGAGRAHFSGNASWPETVPANANCAILLISVEANQAVSATLGGQAMTALTGNPFPFYSGNYTIQAFYLLNPPTGVRTLAITNGNSNNLMAVPTFYAGVQGIWNATNVSTGAGGEQPSMSISNTSSDHCYINAFSYRNNGSWDTFTSYNQNWRAEFPQYSYDEPLFVGDAVGNGGTLTFSATRTHTNYEWGGVVIDLSPVVQRTANLNLSLPPTLGFKAWKPVAFDAVGAGGTGTASYSWTHTIAADATAIVVPLVAWVSAYGITVTVTVGSTPMTQLSWVTDWASGVYAYQNQLVYGLLNPPTGLQTITVNIAGGNSYLGAANSLSYKNVDGFGAPVTSNETGTTATNTIASDVRQMIVQAFSTALSTPPSTVGSYTNFNQTVRYNVAGGANNPPLIIGDAPGASSVTFSATKPSSTGGGIAIPVRAASGYAAFNLGVTPAISMIGTRNNYIADFSLPFNPTVSMSGIGPVTDTFIRANSGSLGANWTNKVNSLAISSNTATLGATANCAAMYNTPAATDDVTVQVILVNCYWDSALFLGCNTSGAGAMLRMPANGTNGFKMQIASTGDWGATQSVKAETTVTWTAGDVVTFTRVGNVYTAYQNGVQRVTWTDSGNVITRDSNHRYCGLGGSASGAYPTWSQFGIMPL